MRIEKLVLRVKSRLTNRDLHDANALPFYFCSITLPSFIYYRIAINCSLHHVSKVTDQWFNYPPLQCLSAGDPWARLPTYTIKNTKLLVSSRFDLILKDTDNEND